MKTARLAPTALILTLALLLCSNPTVQAQETLTSSPAADVQTLQRENAQLKERVKQLEAKLAELRGTTEQLTSDNQLLEQQTQQLEAKSDRLQAQADQFEKISSISAKGEMVAAVEGLISQGTDKASGRSIVWTDPEQILVERGSSAEHAFSLRMFYPGKRVLGPPDEIVLRFYVNQAQKNPKVPQELRLDLSSGDQTLPITEAQVDRKRSTSSRRKINMANMDVDIALSLEQLRAIAQEDLLTGKLGKAEFLLRAKDMALLRAMLKRVDALQ